MRKCLVTGERKPQSALIRFVAGPDGAVVPDVDGRLPGRGLWVTASRGMIDQAAEKRLFSRGARQPVKAPPGLADTVATLVKRRVLSLLGLARRAGHVVSGFEKVRAAVQDGTAALVFEARDGAEGGRRKAVGSYEGPVIDAFSAAELGAALGRDMAVHVAVTDRPMAEKIRADAAKFAGLAETP